MAGEKSSPEDLSFGALREGMEHVFDRPEIEVPDHSPTGEALSLSEQEKLREKKEMEARINAKVLGASGAASAPMWIRGFLISGVAAFLLFFLVFNSGMKSFQPIGSYITMLVGAGAALWNTSGVMQDGEPMNRALSAAAGVVALAVVGLAYMHMGS